MAAWVPSAGKAIRGLLPFLNVGFEGVVSQYAGLSSSAKTMGSVETFEGLRPRLLAIAYRMLSSSAERKTRGFGGTTSPKLTSATPLRG